MQIYIPIYEDTSHWYLMVICINDKKFYHLDSNMTLEFVEDRRQVIRTKVGATIIYNSIWFHYLHQHFKLHLLINEPIIFMANSG